MIANTIIGVSTSLGGVAIGCLDSQDLEIA